jgi:DNA repair ATPase RecN
MEQRMHQVEQRLDNLEKQEREYAFTVRDIAHKTTIALGILTAQEHDMKEMKVTLEQHSNVLDEHGAMLRQILQLLQQSGGDR